MEQIEKLPEICWNFLTQVEAYQTHGCKSAVTASVTVPSTQTSPNSPDRGMPTEDKNSF